MERFRKLSGKLSPNHRQKFVLFCTSRVRERFLLVPRASSEAALSERGEMVPQTANHSCLRRQAARERYDMKNRRGRKNERPRILAAYTCKRCEIEGQDLEVSPERALCWNCEDEAKITARIAMESA
jgi:hypothetical protein